MQGAIRSEWLALYKGRNAAMSSWGRSLRAGTEVAIRCVVPLGKGEPFPARHALRLAASVPAEWVNISGGVH